MNNKFIYKPYFLTGKLKRQFKINFLDKAVLGYSSYLSFLFIRILHLTLRIEK